ncbi:MAG: rhodanese-like domain-containing protein [Rhodobacter sp.]|nr:rhodanese-like domain-containing protein [Rhodobacter sp.]
MKIDRRRLCAVLASLPLQAASSAAWAQAAHIWSVRQTYRALLDDSVRLLDIRSRDEWRDTGVARGAWLVSMHERRFAERLFAARDLAGDRPVALICAVGGRTGSVMQALRQAGYTGFVDVSEGMLGSPVGRGWIAEGLPVVTIDEALAGTPQSLL